LAVTAVAPGSAAALALLHVSDRILAVDDANAADVDLRDVLAAKRPGADITLRYQRDGVEQTTHMTLAERSKNEPRLTPLPNPTPQQSAILSAWLGEQTDAS
jgi:S1-C subfamily serine protease